jgi:molybdate transport system ATP-binding protein
MPRFDVDASLRQGTFTLELALSIDVRALALFGPSGCGKTTALEMLAGLRMPERGRLAIDGRVLFDGAGRVHVPPRLRRIGYVPQDVLLFPHLDVRGNVHYGRRPGVSVDERGLLDLLELKPLFERTVASLSGGERQRVAIARALFSAPELLLLDEPLAAVDLKRRARIVASLVRIRDELNVPLVYVTHSPEEAIAVADYAVVLDRGQVVMAGSPREVLPA